VPCGLSEGPYLWRGAVASLGAILGELSDVRSMAATLILSNHFVRYAVIPQEDKLDGEIEYQAYARHYFTALYGELANQWEIRISNGGYSTSCLASAVDYELIANVNEMLMKASVKSVSLQPLFMAMFNCWRRQLHEPTFCLAFAETDRLCLAKITHGEWISLRNQRVADSVEQTLTRLLAHEALLQESDGAMPLYCLGTEEIVLASDSTWSLRSLDILSTRRRSQGREILALISRHEAA